MQWLREGTVLHFEQGGEQRSMGVPTYVTIPENY